MVDRGGDIEHRLAAGDLHRQLDAALAAGVVVVEFDDALAAVEQRRR